jgi:hypothetical protein
LTCAGVAFAHFLVLSPQSGLSVPGRGARHDRRMAARNECIGFDVATK